VGAAVLNSGAVVPITHAGGREMGGAAMAEQLMPFDEALEMLQVSCTELRELVERGEIQMFSYLEIDMFRWADVVELKARMEPAGELVGKGSRAAF